MKLITRIVEKPWGRTDIPSYFHAPDSRIGEIWFEHPQGRKLALMAKYLFTSERLSIQVHPDNEQAAALGQPSGKDEMWIVLAADEGAHIGIGLAREVSSVELKAAALDGSIEQLMEWRPVKAGDVFYNPAGNIHSLGPGLTILEIQQTLDLTYRLYDYDRPRELHLEAGLAVSATRPVAARYAGQFVSGVNRMLVDGPIFRVLWCCGPCDGVADGPVQILPVDGTIEVAGEEIAPGECALVPEGGIPQIPPGVNTVLFWPL